MSSLSVAEMKAAIYARACDLDPNTASGEESARYDQDVHGYGESVNKYRQGKQILEKYTLRYDHHSTVYTMSNGKIPGEGDGVAVLRVESGFVGTMQAYSTAIFNLR